MFLKNSSNGWTHKKWIGLILVSIGMPSKANIAKLERKDRRKMDDVSKIQRVWINGIGDACLSAFGGVYVEFVLNERKGLDSLAEFECTPWGYCLIARRLTYLDFLGAAWMGRLRRV